MTLDYCLVLLAETALKGLKLSRADYGVYALRLTRAIQQAVEDEIKAVRQELEGL